MQFEKVSFDEFKKALENSWFVTPEWIYCDKALYDRIRIPVRKTRYSAGYDFAMPFSCTIGPGRTAYIPTGIRCIFSAQERESWHLKMYIRSSAAKTHRIRLEHSVGVIDPDYSDAHNEGHIYMPLLNTGRQPVQLEMGERICQGIFEIHGVVYGDKASGGRTGGFGSTGSV